MIKIILLKVLFAVCSVIFFYVSFSSSNRVSQNVYSKYDSVSYDPPYTEDSVVDSPTVKAKVFYSKAMDLKTVSTVAPSVNNEELIKVTTAVPTTLKPAHIAETTVRFHSTAVPSDAIQSTYPSPPSEAVTPQSFSEHSERPNPSLLNPTLPSSEPRKVYSHRRKNLFGSQSQWRKAFRNFQEFQESKNKSRNKVVYVKRGTTGISGEIIGICDSLLVAMLVKKRLEFTSQVITDHLFNFTLSNVYFHSTPKEMKKTREFVPPLFEENYRLIATGRDKNDPFMKPVSSFGGYGPVLITTLHVMADRIFRSEADTSKFVDLGIIKRKNGIPKSRTEFYNLVDVYYTRCVQSLFPPSPSLQTLIESYETLLGQGLRIGVHIRMGQGHSDWKDSRAFLNQKRVVSFIGKLQQFVKIRREKLGNATSIKIFLSTDSSAEEKLMKKRFPGMIVTTSTLKRSHVGGIRHAEVGEEAVLKAVLDVMLLGKCDFLYLTPRSGFSKIGLYFAEEGTPYRYILIVC